MSIYDPYKLALVPREKVVKNFKIKDEEYEVEVINWLDSKQKLSKKNVSKIIMLALAGALTLGASAATVNLFSYPSMKAQMENNDDCILYDIPADITGSSNITVKVYPDGKACVGEEELEFYNGKRVEELIHLASAQGKLYRHFGEMSRNR